MAQGIELNDLAKGARVHHCCVEETAPGSAATEKHFGFIPMVPIRVLKVRCVLLVDGTGSGNTVTIDVLDDGTSVLSTTPDFVTGDSVDTINDEAVVDATKQDVAAGSLVQVSLASAGTITAGHLVGVDIQYLALATDD